MLRVDILYTAIYFDKEDVLKYALTRYKDINDRVYSDEYGLTLLTYACKLSNVKLAHILLEHGINVNGCQSPCDTYKVYPIMEAIANNNIELVKLLLEYHADLDIKDSNGSTPLALAKETGAKEIENLLLQWMKQKNNAKQRRITDKPFPAEPLTLIYYNMIEIEQWGKMIIWLWSRYIKKKPIPYIDLEFHYPMWMFYLVGGILGGLILGIALFYFTVIN